MSSKIWHDISYIFLTSGIAFLILTIVLSIKFQIFSMIKSEFGNKKKKEISAGEDYFAYVENKNKSLNNIEEIKNMPVTEPDIRKNAPEKPMNRQAADDPPSTVLISSAKSSAPQSGAATVVNSRRTALNMPDSDSLVIKDSIIVIHGNPDVISVQ